MLRYENEIRCRFTPRNRLSQSPVTYKSRSPWLLGRCSLKFAGANIMYSLIDPVPIFQHYFETEEFAARTVCCQCWLRNILQSRRKIKVRILFYVKVMEIFSNGCEAFCQILLINKVRELFFVSLNWCHENLQIFLWLGLRFNGTSCFMT